MANKLLPLEEKGQVVAYAFLCRGCGMNHAVYARPHKSASGTSWNFNGDLERPTFSPSILIKVKNSYTGQQLTCHFSIENGYICFFGNCNHFLAGRTVEMNDVDSPQLFASLKEQNIDVYC